jgi:hypothetical protein
MYGQEVIRHRLLAPGGARSGEGIDFGSLLAATVAASLDVLELATVALSPITDFQVTILPVDGLDGTLVSRLACLDTRARSRHDAGSDGKEGDDSSGTHVEGVLLFSIHSLSVSPPCNSVSRVL